MFSAGVLDCTGVSARAAEDNAAWGRGGGEGETVPRVRLRAGCVFRGEGGAGVCVLLYV